MQQPSSNEHRRPGTAYGRPGTEYRRPSSAYKRRQAKTRKRRLRRKRITGAAVLGGLVVVIMVAALLFSNHTPLVQPAPSGLPVSQGPAGSAPAVSKVPLLPAATGAFDVEGIPPLFNASHLIPDGYEVDLVEVGGGQSMHAPAAAAFLAMKEAAAEGGVALSPVSGYRSHEHQVTNYNNSVQNYISQGYSEEEAIRLTRRYYAIPGTSEHEAGLAMDIGSIEDSFEFTPAFAWLQEHAAEYGFIMRYYADKEEITGVAYEPWHYRYVGVNHANKMVQLGVTALEEYVAMLEADAGISSGGVASDGSQYVGVG